MLASLLIRFRGRAGFFCQQLAGGGGHHLVAGADSFSDEVTVRRGSAGIELDSRKRAGFLLDIAPELAVAHYRRRRGYHHAGHRFADRGPYLEPLAFTRIAALEKREKAAAGHGGV